MKGILFVQLRAVDASVVVVIVIAKAKSSVSIATPGNRLMVMVMVVAMTVVPIVVVATVVLALALSKEPLMRGGCQAVKILVVEVLLLVRRHHRDEGRRRRRHPHGKIHVRAPRNELLRHTGSIHRWHGRKERIVMVMVVVRHMVVVKMDVVLVVVVLGCLWLLKKPRKKGNRCYIHSSCSGLLCTARPNGRQCLCRGLLLNR